MNEAFGTVMDVRRNFQGLRAAFEVHLQRSAVRTGTIPITDIGDDFRVSPDPYPGLRSFTPEEGGVFFGRERNVNEVRERLANLNFAVVLGGSGSGKSSLIRAGLIPRLNSTKGISGRCGNWYAVEFRPRLHPIHEMTGALSSLLARISDQADAKLNIIQSNVASWLRQVFGDSNAQTDRSAEAEVLSEALFEFVDDKLDQLDRAASHGLRSGKPSLLLVVDQFEEVFRPEVAIDPNKGGSKLLDMLIATCIKLAHKRKMGKQTGLFIVITMRSEELHRCAEHPTLVVNLQGQAVGHSLADVVNEGIYLLDLLDPEQDRSDLRDAIVRPARRVFDDWGLPLDINNPDAPFASGVVDWLLSGAERLSQELEHRPDQLPLLQHALQTIWRGAMEDWTSNRSHTSHEILREHLRCGAPADGTMSPPPDLAACLDARADLTAREGVRRFAEALRSYTAKLSKPLSPEYAFTAGLNIIRGAFRALAQHDDRGNWARRFAEIDVIETFSIAGDENCHLIKCQYNHDISTALSSFVSHGYLVFKDGYYDISHEALIRNWKQYQEWLRDPQEISRALTRAVADLDPGHLAGDTPEAKDDLVGSLPPSLCSNIDKALKRHELPEAWVVEQILPLVNRPDVVKRWGTRNPKDILASLDGLVARAQCIRTKRASARARKERNRWLIIAGTAATCLLLVVGFSWWREHEASQAALTNHSKSIALHADDHLDHEGPAQAILVAMQARKAGLPDIPEIEQVIYKSLRQLREKRALPAPTVNSATSDPTGKILAGVSAGGSIQFWRLADGALIDRYDLDITGPAQTMGMNWSPDGTRLAIGVGERTAIVTPCSHAKLLPLFSSCGQTDDQDKVTWLGFGATKAGPGKFSKDGKLLITGNWRSRAKVWNIDTGENIDLGVDTAFPWAVALAPDMQTAAIGTGQGTIHIINVTTHEDTLLKIPDSEVPGAITSVDFGNRSDSLLVATQNGQVWLFNVGTRTPARVAGQHGQAFQTAFSSDGKRVATASGDGALRIWPVDRVSEQPFVLRGHDGPVYSLQFTQDGETLVSASADGTIRIWSVVSALHPDVGRNSSSAQPPIDAPYSLAPLAERKVHDGSEIRATNAQGYTIVAYNGTNSHLGLFGPGSTTTPISEWGDRIPVKWRSVSFDRRSDKNDDSDLIVAVSITGDTYTWPYFKDFVALTKYAMEQLPYLAQKQLELPEMELCKLDLVVDRSRCSTTN